MIVNILFWLFFTLTDIPYLAFGGELATDYDERTRIRKFARLFMSCADIIAIAGTLPFAMLAQIIKLSGASMFWTIIFSMVYDITEVDEFQNGTRREGILTSLNSFFMKVGVSLGMWFAGVMMDVIGLDPEAASQTAEVVGRLNFCAKMIPAIIALAAMAISFQYRISHDKFVQLQTELEKSEGERNTLPMALKTFYDF